MPNAWLEQEVLILHVTMPPIVHKPVSIVVVQTPVIVHVNAFTKVATIVNVGPAPAETLVTIAPPSAKINANVDKTIFVIFMIDKYLEFYNLRSTLFQLFNLSPVSSAIALEKADILPEVS